MSDGTRIPPRLPPARPAVSESDEAAEIARRHAEAVTGERSTYADPRTGLSVFTAEALRRRGWCCGSGCRHCPYPPELRRRR